MRHISACLAIVSAMLVTSCANDGPTTEEVGQQLQRGVTGQGQLGDINRGDDDPYVKPREGAPRNP